MHVPEYVLLGAPRRYADGRRKEAKFFSQRFRLLHEPVRRIRSVSLKTKDGAVARRRSVAFVEARIREIVLERDALARTVVNSIRDALQEHLDDLLAVGNTEKQVSLVKYRIEQVIVQANFKEYVQLDAVKVSKAIAELQAKGEFKTTATANHYRATMRTWSHWMMRNGRWPTNPLEAMEKFKGDTTPSRRRAILTEKQFHDLLATTRSGPTRRKLTGEQRFWLYLLASQTGLRAQELHSLTPSSFYLAGESPYLEVHCTISKRRQTDRIDLHPDLAAAVQKWLRGKSRTRRLWAGSRSWWYKAAHMLRHDLANAGLKAEVTTSQGPAVVDFHSFRCYRVTQAILTGKSTRVVLAAVRLSSEQLLDRYAKIPRTEISDCARAIPLPAIVSGLAR